MRRSYRVVLAIILFAFLVGVSTEGRKSPTKPEEGFDGVVQVSTAENGLWTFVTVARDAGSPVQTAFLVQYQNPMPSGPVLLGSGRVTVNGDSLTVAAQDASIAFKFPSHQQALPAGTIAFDAIGIAKYTWKAGGAAARPQSHAEFAARTTLLIPPYCGGLSCSCGGSGAQSCNCDDHQVSCYAPYVACCTATNAYCCREQ